ncbi:MAG TPA: hypothetical protein VM283_00965, partial [Armatimonadota bacterium]|nr:hypothetical protein [Armatimonadota bacterium]
MRARAAWRYLKRQQRRLRLADWQIGLGVQATDCLNGQYKEGRPLVGQMIDASLDVPTAQIHVTLRRDEADVRDTIRHELLHVRLAELQWVFEQALSTLPEGEQALLLGH